MQSNVRIFIIYNAMDARRFSVTVPPLKFPIQYGFSIYPNRAVPFTFFHRSHQDHIRITHHTSHDSLTPTRASPPRPAAPLAPNKCNMGTHGRRTDDRCACKYTCAWMHMCYVSLSLGEWRAPVTRTNQRPTSQLNLSLTQHSYMASASRRHQAALPARMAFVTRAGSTAQPARPGSKCVAPRL